VLDDFLIGARLSGGAIAQPSLQWLRSLFLARTNVRSLSRWLLAPAPPESFELKASKTLCTCFGVSEAEISESLARALGDGPARLAAVQEALRCGTNCGSCVPELKRLAQRAAATTEQPA
jgi:assimilatory nitrate reductase catalytic subunit